MDIDTFLNTVRIQKNKDDATDLIFNTIDTLLNNGSFDTVDAILYAAEPAELPAYVRSALLTITMAAKNKLPSRKAFYEESFQLLAQEKGLDYASRVHHRHS